MKWRQTTEEPTILAQTCSLSKEANSIFGTDYCLCIMYIIRVQPQRNKNEGIIKAFSTERKERLQNIFNNKLVFHICITVIAVLISYLLTFLTTEGSCFCTFCGWNQPQEIVQLVLILIEIQKKKKQFNTILINFNEYELILITCLKGTHNIWLQLHIISSLLADNTVHELHADADLTCLQKHLF